MPSSLEALPLIDLGESGGRIQRETDMLRMEFGDLGSLMFPGVACKGFRGGFLQPFVFLGNT